MSTWRWAMGDEDGSGGTVKEKATWNLKKQKTHIHT
jgi:hypothetical protein